MLLRVEQAGVRANVRKVFDQFDRNDDGVVYGTASLLIMLDRLGIQSPSKSIMGAYTTLGPDGRVRINLTDFARLVAVLEEAKVFESPQVDGAEGDGGLGAFAFDAVTSFSRGLVTRSKESEDAQVAIALRRMQRDMTMLDRVAGATTQLNTAEVVILGATIAISFASPYLLATKAVEVLVPSMSALCAAIGFSCEYTGKVAISRGKEIAATTLQAAAEAELYLAQAERAKAIVPLTVGASAALAAFALLAPALVSELVSKGFVEIVTEVYLLCPIFAILAAAIAALATQESVSLSSRAVGVGARRFASSDDVGRTWLSATEQIESSSRRAIYKWRSFSLGVLPAPFLAAIVPGPLSFKAIIASAVAAAQCAYSLAVVEFSLATAVESVALKARAAATSDTYANQGARAGAILPFTSALSGLCAATTVAIVEVLPLIASPFGESLVCAFFPAVGATIAGAASISKARCEVDAAAATAAATELADTYLEGSQKNPLEATGELVLLTLRALRRSLSLRRLNPGFIFGALLRKWRSVRGKSSDVAPQPIATPA